METQGETVQIFVLYVDTLGFKRISWAWVSSFTSHSPLQVEHRLLGHTHDFPTSDYAKGMEKKYRMLRTNVRIKSCKHNVMDSMSVLIQ